MKPFLPLALAALTLVACPKTNADGTPSESTGSDAARAVPVKVEDARKGELIRSLKLNGVARAWQSANLAPMAQGTVESMTVGIGMDVVKGQLLAEIDTKTLTLQAEQAQRTVELARLQAEDATRELGRAESLVGSGAIADATVDKTRFGERIARAQLAQAEAAVAVVEAQLSNARLVAPFSGTVTAVAVDPGEFWSPAATLTGPPTLVVIDNLDVIRVDVHLNDTDLSLVHPGLPVVARSLALPGSEWQGKVALVNASADAGARTFTAVLSIPNPTRTLRPGMFVDVGVVVESRPEVISVPEQAISQDATQAFVMVLENDRAKRFPVTPGLRGDLGVEVVGLPEGARVLIEGQFGLPDGSTVRVVN